MDDAPLRRKRNRRPKPAEACRTEIVKLRCTPSEREQLAARVPAGMTEADYVRQQLGMPLARPAAA